jgi:hypothetical protein
MKMTTILAALSLAAATGALTGCLTSAKASTRRVAPDGTVTESRVSIIGTGDKTSQIAAEGLYADGADGDDLGAGVRKASASQQSTGIKEALEGLGSFMREIRLASSDGQSAAVPAAVSAPSAASAVLSVSAPAQDEPPSYAYSAEGYDGSPGADGSGVYGRPSCGRCRAYRAAHPDVEIINVDSAANASAMWSAIKARGFAGGTAALPVAISSDGYVLSAK